MSLQKNIRNKLMLPTIACLVFEIFCVYQASSQTFSNNLPKAITITGRFSYIFSNGDPPKTNNYNFVALTTAAIGWKLSATNENQPKDWATMQYDGTNIYKIGADSLNGYKIYSYTYPGSFYLPEGDNPPYLFFPWMTFYLTPHMIHDFERKRIEIPPPWGKRFSLMDYGYKWKTTYSLNEAAIQKIEVVRDSSLDLKTEEDELRRAGLNYPFEYSQLDHRSETLRGRKSVPNGFVRAVFECNNLYQTNGWVFPSAAEFAQYWPNLFDPQGPIRLVFQMTLQVDTVSLSQTGEVPEIILPKETSVHDYRYQATNNRTKFNYASYTLNAGETFPPDDDPKLLAQAQDWLKNGPAYASLEPKRHKILAAMLTVTLFMSGLLVFWLKKQQTIKHKQK